MSYLVKKTVLPPRRMLATDRVQQLPSRGRDIRSIHSQHQLYCNPHHHNSCFECLKLDVMDTPTTTELFLSAFCDLFSVAQSEATSPSYSV